MARVKKENYLQAPEGLKALITIVDREKASFYLDVLEGYDINFQMVFYGRGTAPAEIYHYLGIDAKKAVIISFVKASKIKELLANYEDKYFKTHRGKGVAITVGIESLIGVSTYKFLANQKEE